jgi:hypothetical protein
LKESSAEDLSEEEEREIVALMQAGTAKEAGSLLFAMKSLARKPAPEEQTSQPEAK